MTLNMSNNLEEFYAQEFQQNGKESIHSGQFMVSHFEAEEQDDDDSEIKMPDPDDPNLEKEVTDSNICTEVQRYVPQQYNEPGTSMIITTRLEIETNLSKLFKCMNLAYSQKLTSPKWNHFKGVRLRWKDKIRLNNVIWRCWHMQFIMKMKTPVCQFASPLDVDIHSNPQSVVLEGKYWKRQLSVIKAEYRKWRRNFKTKATGNLICDTRSEFDFLEWSPLPNDRNLMITEDWTSDTLFSAINVPFPFPDPREIARGAGIADFIQPSLGPLQPNLDDIDITTFQELLQTGISARLAPVPEEVNEDIFRTVEFNNFSALMGTEQMDSSNLIDVTNTAQGQEITNQLEDANMIELNTPLNSIEYADKIYSQNMDIQQEQNIIGGQNDLNVQIINSSGFGNQINENTQSAVLLSQPKHNSVVGNNFTISNTTPINSSHSISEIPLLQSNNQIGNFPSKYILKGRVSKTSSRPFRREPHNYDKAQPTSHQTNIYQQMLAEQQKQQQSQTQILNQLPFSQQFSNTPIITSNNFPLQSGSLLNMPPNTGNNAAVKSYSVPQTLQTVKVTNQKLGSNQSEILSLLNMNNVGQFSPSVHQTNQSTSYKPYPSVQSLKKAASTAGYINISPRNIQNSTPANQSINFKFDQQQPTSNQALPSKEMFRSNSLPLNSSLPRIEAKEETFAVPKYQAKTNRSRTRSNSMQQQSPTFQPTPQLQTATSEPMLHSTLAQLLTTTNPSKLASKNSSSTNSITLSPLSLPPSGFNTTSSTSTSNNFQTQTISLQQPLSPLKMHSPPRTKILSLPSTPITNLSPDSFHDQDSPLSPTRVSSGSNLKFPRETQRRAGHIHAEQKRRYNIKNGFDMLHSLIPQLQQNPSAKLSKAAMLQKGAEYIKQLRTERTIISEKMDSLRKERDNLNNSLAHLHSILPANGAPVSRQRTERVKQLYNQYVRYRTMENWKFWILGLILEPLINSYTTTVSMASIEELYRTALLWVDQHCSLVELRPAVSNKLRYISTTTDILSDPPSTLQEEVLKALNNTSGEHPNLNSS